MLATPFRVTLRSTATSRAISFPECQQRPEGELHGPARAVLRELMPHDPAVAENVVAVHVAQGVQVADAHSPLFHLVRTSERDGPVADLGRKESSRQTTIR